VHDEETPAGSIVPPPAEDEVAGEPILAQPQPGLMDLWHQASPEERKLFVATYHEELRTLLAAWDEETHPRTRTVSPKKKQRRKVRPS
jgi:hypothetical protein